MIRQARNILVAVTLTGLAGAAHAQTEASHGAHAPTVRNVVLVHGAFADGSGWRGVYDRLTAQGYKVSIVQNPLTSLADDVAATRRVLARQDGPTILVGHSYGGTVITEAGADPKVAGLVYVAALAPDTGESTGDQFAEIPAPAGFVIEPQADGFGFVNLAKFKSGFAADISDADAAFMRDSQVPIAMSAFGDKVTNAAWRVKPSWFVVATEDGAIDPKLLRKTAIRIGAEAVEIKGSHVVFLSRPDAVADVIDTAAKTAFRKKK
ncbi:MULTISPECIES: alpha/beta fold hydrolase [unclassified Caulobacter]|jgi:pimeloyl-ACP methyl ester carboxylesterase|uniref:alpha/beta fold hydrolase n=1 Tax=unclassified Caulobacter TaxID=2648921 RepID=UPI000784C041|nr:MULTISPECIES: alpha/beta hydrolase [unclassified Caulobacter]AZS22096.1 alpha/beta hydrolase [Caulobacter sp. FWC26]